MLMIALHDRPHPSGLLLERYKLISIEASILLEFFVTAAEPLPSTASGPTGSGLISEAMWNGES